MIRAPGFVVILFLAVAAGVFAAEPSGGGGGGNAPLRMEELEVRGFRDKPEVLHVPVHLGIVLPSPVRYDLFLDDLERPVYPREISPGSTGP